MPEVSTDCSIQLCDKQTGEMRSRSQGAMLRPPKGIITIKIMTLSPELHKQGQQETELGCVLPGSWDFVPGLSSGTDPRKSIGHHKTTDCEEAREERRSLSNCKNSKA